MTSLDPALARFFEGVAPLLAGEVGADGFVSDVGPSPSTAARLEVYTALCWRNPRRVLRGVYRATHHAAESRAPDRFEGFLTAFLDQKPIDHWDLPRLARGFSAFLVEHLAASDLGPEAEVLGELADYEEIRLEHRIFEDPEIEGPLAPTLEVRQYTHNVAEVVAAWRQREEEIALAPTPETLLVFRDPHTRRSRTLVPTLPMLLAVAHAAGEMTKAEVAAAGVDEAALTDATAALLDEGVLTKAPAASGG